MARDPSIYSAAVEVSKEFLGPAGERFLRRQISTHLAIEPEDLERHHLQELVSWVKLTFAVLTNDSGLVEDFSDRLLALGANAESSIGKVSNAKAT
jgi:hypothetical protein